MRNQRIKVAGIDAVAIRVSFSGDLGWEIYVPLEHQLALYDALLEAGRELGARPVGGRALLSLRVEKGYGSWSREYSPEYWPQEVGLDRLIKLDKPEFLGREAYLAIKDNPPREKLVVVQVDTSDADASGGEPVFLTDGTPVGRVSSGAFGHSVGASIALCFIKTEHAVADTELDVAILGIPHRAVILEKPPFDAKGERLRA
jgi:dimethylglycine dehydrogenase